MRNFKKSILKIGIFSNPLLIGAIIIGILLQFVVIMVPFLANAFGVQFLGLTDWIIAIGLALIPLIVNECIKKFMKKTSL